MSHPLTSHLCASASYSSLASQATLTDETTAAPITKSSKTCGDGSSRNTTTAPLKNDDFSKEASQSNECLSYHPVEKTSSKAIDEFSITIRNHLPIAAAVETKVAGAHHHRHRSLVHHYSPFAYLPKRPKEPAAFATLATEEEIETYPTPQQPDLTRNKKEKVIVLLGECLLKSGCPGHRAEEALQHSARILGLSNASFSLLPETVLVTFMTENRQQQQSLMIKSPQSLDMGKIGQVQQIMNKCLRAAHDDDELDQCIRSLLNVSNSPPTWGLFGTIFAFFVSSFTACAMLFDGSWIDSLMSGVLGLVVGVLYVLASHRPIYGRVFEISACVFVSALAQALHPFCCFTSVAVSGVLILLPGYAMTMAVMELSARRVTTGTVRLIYAVFYAFLLAYGFQIGSRAYASIAEAFGTTDTDKHADDLCGQNPISPWFYIPLLPLLSISIGISYGSSIRQSYAQLGGAIIAFCICYFMSKVVPDPPIVESTAAFAVGLYSHFVLKLTGEPPLISVAVGITLLVPGSIGVKGAYALLHQEDTNQTLFPIKMLTVALGLAAGLFASAMIVYPAGKKRTLLISL